MLSPRIGLLLAMSGFVLQADTRQVMKITMGGQTYTSAEYQQGPKQRFEPLSGSSTGRVTIYNYRDRRTYNLNPKSQEYVESEQPAPNLLENLARWITHPLRSGKTVNVYHDVIDLHEQKQLLGMTATHLVLRERRVSEAGACLPSQETKTDGWFVPKRDAQKLIARGRIEFSNGCSDTVIQHGDENRRSDAVLETTGSTTYEIAELSNEPLDASLFEPPPGWRKIVETRDWRERLHSDWSQLEDAAATWFR